MPAHTLIQRRAQPEEPTSVEVVPQSTTAAIGQETMVVKIGDPELEDIKSLQNDDTRPTAVTAPVSSSSVRPVLELETGAAAAPPNDFEDVFETAKPSASAAASDSASNTSVGVKAGIAFGVIGVALFLGWLIFFFIGRRKKQALKNKKERKARRHDAEKQAGEKPVVVRSLATDVAADNRPVTTFFTNNGVNKPLPSVEDLAPPKPVAFGAERRARTDSRLWNRPVSTLSSHIDNPFGLHAERIPSPDRYPTPSRSPSPIMVNESLPREIPNNEYEPAAAVAPLAPLARKASLRKNAVADLDLPKPAFSKMPNVPGSPAMTEYSMSGAPTSDAPASTVHRVQQDFEPTMEDEMELKAGQLVRLLHEFDDGWALCVRLDNTKQGVVPRTCISTRPLKPRSQNGDATSSRR